MLSLSNASRSDDFSEASSKDGDFEESSKSFYKELINKANSVPLNHVFRHYGYKIDEQNRKMTCPFPFHKNGKESTSSFWFYPQTNSFWCFGCKTGNYATDFVAAIDKSSKLKAAYKVINLFENEVDPEYNVNLISFEERLLLLLDFSDFVREYRLLHLDDLKLKNKIEALSAIFDKINNNLELDNEALKSLIINIKERANIEA